MYEIPKVIRRAWSPHITNTEVNKTGMGTMFLALTSAPEARMLFLKNLFMLLARLLKLKKRIARAHVLFQSWRKRDPKLGLH